MNDCEDKLQTSDILDQTPSMKNEIIFEDSKEQESVQNVLRFIFSKLHQTEKQVPIPEVPKISS